MPSTTDFIVRSQTQFTRESGAGPLNVLTQSPYDFKKTQYPAEGLGSTVPSYVVFYVNLPDPAKFTVQEENYINESSISDQNIQKSRGALNPKLISGETAKAFGIAGTATLINAGEQIAIDASTNSLGRYGDLATAGGAAVGTVLKGAIAGTISSIGQNVDKKPKMQRIKEAIAIYMPDTVMHTYSHDYDVQSLTAAMGDVGKAQRAAGAISGSVGNGITETIAAVQGLFGSSEPTNPQVSTGGGYQEVIGSLAEKSGMAGAGFTDFLLRGKGLALNPQVELLFKGTANRGFIFDFKFQPKNRKEAETINNIIFIFRRYAAPSLAATAADPGSYFIPPGQFDIQYYFKNEENKFIGRISTCVLENIDINYSSAGQWATYDDGSPVEINMQLRFKEVDILTRAMIDQGF